MAAAQQVYAQIFEDEVKNVIVAPDYEAANWVSRATFGAAAFAVDCLQFPCKAGDRYRDGVFYKVLEDGTEKQVEYVPTAEQEVEMLKAEAAATAEYQMELDYRLSCQEIGLEGEMRDDLYHSEKSN